MIKHGTRFFSLCCLIICFFFFVFWPFNSQLNALNIKKNDELIERISKDFSTKFCNGVGFGLSEESAVNFAMKENMAIFKKKKGIENIDAKAIAEKVIISVGDKCGYSLNLSGDQWEMAFKTGGLN